jgi:hypothetical protein
MTAQHGTHTSATSKRGLGVRHARRWRSVTPLLVAFLLLAPAPFLGISGASAAGGTDSTCTQASIQSDLQRGGTWTLDCAAATTSILFSTPVTFSTGIAAVQVAAGKHVILDGGHTTGLLTITGGTLRISGLTLQNANTGLSLAEPGGAAIFTQGTLTVTSSTFAGNEAASGGAIFNADSASLSVRDSTFAGNSAQYGGALYNKGLATVTNSTFSANSACPLGCEGGGLGGAIANYGTLAVRASTFSGNTAYSDPRFSDAPRPGGALETEHGTLRVHATILAANPYACGTGSGAVITDEGYNLEYQSGAALSCGFTNHAITNQNPLLGPLQDNGGPTQTMALGAGNPAIDAVPVASCLDAQGQPLTTDQRGVTRPQGPACDSGAYEANAAGSPLFRDGFESGNFSAWTAVNTNAGGTAVVENYLAAGGQFAARLSATTSAGSYAYARKALSVPATNLTVSGDFNVRAQGAAGSTVPLFRLFDPSGALVVSLYRLNLTNGELWVQADGAYRRTTGMLALKSWGHLQLQVVEAGAGTSTVAVWLNGTLIYQNRGLSLGTTGVQTLQMGNEAHGQIFDLVADNIVAQ